jgi:hypothetical protein
MFRDRAHIKVQRSSAFAQLAANAALLVLLALLLPLAASASQSGHAPRTSAAAYKPSAAGDCAKRSGGRRASATECAAKRTAKHAAHVGTPRDTKAVPAPRNSQAPVPTPTAKSPQATSKPAEAGGKPSETGGKKEAGAGAKQEPGASAPAEADSGPVGEEGEAGGEGLQESEGEGGSASPAAEPGRGNLPVETGELLSDPIDPRFLTDVPFGKRSFWLQPWRAYLDTWPASRLLESVGINFPANPKLAEGSAQILQESGFKLARMQISWNALSYETPTTFIPSHLASIGARLTAMHDHGLRPLIVLDADSELPTPFKLVKLETTAAAPAGARTVKLSPASAALVVPSRTGFNGLTWPGAADVLITSVGAGDVASLSRPLRSALAAGSHAATTLRYAPFQSPTLAGGQPNPEYEATLTGWLAYVRAVCDEAASVVGAGGYDIEVWNELSFGSQFLNSENYYSSTSESEPGSEGEEETGGATEGETEGEGESETGTAGEAAVQAGSLSSPRAATATKPKHVKSHKALVSKEIRKALLDETVAYIRNPANGLSPAVGITDGFASETPFPSGADAPLGLTALSKHPYTGAKDFPAAFREEAIRPIDALGGRDTASNKSFTPLFIPEYQSLFPEYWLTATSTETLIRDIAPFTTYIYGFPHGREVGPVGGVPVQKWITEFNLIPGRGKVMGPDEVTPMSGGSATLTPADKEHFQAKVALRSLVSNVNKGITREYFYKAGPGTFGLISQGFFSALEADPGVYPGNQLGGETMTGMRRMLAQFQGPGPQGPARQLTLLSIRQEGNHAQFTGDGTAPHPDLYDRDVLAVLPFQSSPTRFVIPVYVMTRDLLTLYEPLAPASDIHRFDLPAERFWITLGNLPETADPPAVSAYDPLLNESTPARLVSREGTTAVFEIAATDYPRLLNIDYPGS